MYQDTVTKPEEVPALSPENMADILSRYTERPVTDEDIRKSVMETPARGAWFEGITDTLHQGEPTRWIAYEDEAGEIVMSLHQQVACTIDWCRGHHLSEADSWDGLTHSTTIFELPEIEKIDGLTMRDSQVYGITKRSGEPRLSVYFNIEGEVRLSDVDTLLEHFEQISDALRAAKAASETLDLSGI